MSKTYIRFYCNDIKVRSTGSEKWYRKHVLSELFLDLNLNIDNTIKPDHDKKIDRLYYILSTSILHAKPANKYIYKVELVRSTPKGKRILKSIILPWAYHPDGTFSMPEEFSERKENDMIDKDIG